MRIATVRSATFLILGGVRETTSEQPKQKTAAAGHFFERLDTNGDGKATLDEAPEEGRMLVEFLLSQLGKKGSDPLDQAEFRELTSRLLHRHPEGKPKDEAAAAAIEASVVRPASENCPACAMGLTAEFVFKRLDVDEDKFVTVTEFTRSPGMQDLAKGREAVGRLDKNGDGRLSWEEFETAYKTRHANCKKPDPATPAANAEQDRPDGRGDGKRFAQVFILRSDQDGDGKISRAEFRGGAAAFDRLDKNKNGFIEADELGDRCVEAPGPAATRPYVASSPIRPASSSLLGTPAATAIRFAECG